MEWYITLLICLAGSFLIARLTRPAGMLHHYVVEAVDITTPPDGTMTMFKFPEGTPYQVIKEFDRGLSEMQNMGRSFFSTTKAVTIKYVDGRAYEVKHETNSNTAKGRESPEAKGHDSERDSESSR